MSTLSQDTIPFGKFKGLSLDKMLKDRKYCEWSLKQPWFPEQYEYLYNRVKNYDPKPYFIRLPKTEFSPLETTITEFLDGYRYFHLTPVDDVELKLSDNEKVCYAFYLSMMENIKQRIIDNLSFAIKAPVRWLKRFEKETGLSRDVFKEFINSVELPNIPYIIEDIKKLAGIDYKGARSYLIAKENSVRQEKHWEKLLKEKYDEDIGTQFQWEKCIFDFIHINNNTIYECKIGLKDFDEDQYRKYTMTLDKYDLVYLISDDAVIDIVTKTIWTTNPAYYTSYIAVIPTLKNPTKFDNILQEFEVKEAVGEGISDYL
jgi:hypothetical protein